MTSALFSALDVLTKPDASTQKNSLLAALKTNRALLLQRLQEVDGRGPEGRGPEGRGFEEAWRLRGEAMASAPWFSGDTPDVAWAFVQECLLLFVALTRHLTAELLRFSRSHAPCATPHTPESAPPLPPDVLSVTQQKTLGAALQFVVSLGLSPYLAAGVGLPLSRRSEFGAMVEQLVHGGAGSGEGAGPAGSRRLLTTTSVLLQMSELSSLATLVFTRHLGDVMAALSQLGYQPLRDEEKMQHQLSADERRSCREALKKLLGKVYQPMVVKELLILQGGPRQSRPVDGSGTRTRSGSAPAWLRRLCGQLLSERLMQPKGVHAVVRAVLEAGTGGDTDWRKCDSVAKILVTCPQSESQETYYTHVCPQIVELLHFRDQLTAQQFQRVATRAALSVVEQQPCWAQRLLLSPLLSPLLRCCSTQPHRNQASNHDVTAGVFPGEEEVAVKEWELTRCVEDVYKIWVVGNRPSAPLLKALEDVLPVIFSLYCFTKRNVSHLRAPCQEILLWFLTHAEPSAGLVALRQLSGLQNQNQVSPGFHFTPGSDGGARLSRRDSCRSQTLSQEDEALYEKLELERWRLVCLMALLSELKHSDLPGELFLQLLQELTSWVEEEQQEVQQQEASAVLLQQEQQEASAVLLQQEQQEASAVLLQQEVQQQQQQQQQEASAVLLQQEQRAVAADLLRAQRLCVLQVLAVMVECVDHSVLLRKNTQVVDFTLTLLQRACVGLEQAPGPGAGPGPGPGPVNPVESQTVSLGLGLVATLLSGPQLTAEDYLSLSQLLPPLRTLAQNHPEPVIQDLASSLRTVIATHGACQPDELDAGAAQNHRDSATRQKNKQKNTEEKDPIGGDPPPAGKALSDWLLEACDPDVPTRAVALRALTRLVQRRDPEAVREQEKLLVLFLENLEHQDSFIYLSAVQGLAALADSYPDRILLRLLSDFQHGPSLPTSDQDRSLETRLKLGEVLMRASRALGDLTPHLGRPLISVFLQGSRDLDPSVRASSLSNLGELCQRLDYAVGPLAQELSSCLTALIKTEQQVEVRRAAVHVIVLLLRGLSDKTTQVLCDVLLDLYRALKWVVRSDQDEVSVLQARLALEELDDIMRSFIFPQQKLEKKIVVLP